MLSYRHSFHAGNFADVLKHCCQLAIIRYLQKKDKPFCYHDSHSAAGIYHVADPAMQKTGEYRAGIAKLWQQTDLPALLQDYIDTIKTLNPTGELSVYPGSPGLAKISLRQIDRLQLTELHPADFNLLSDYFAKDRRAHIHKMDAYQGLKAMLPPPEKRGLVLIDPPYELKTEYKDLIKGLTAAYKRFATGTYAIWYPVVDRAEVNWLVNSLTDSGIRNILQLEFCRSADSDGFGMTGSGMIVINPPYTLANDMAPVLDYLQAHLGDQTAFVTNRQLVAE